MILAGDVGGTKTNVALYRREGAALRREDMRTFRSGEYASLETILSEFMAGRGGGVELACVGVAGPVVGGKSRLTNLGWEVDGEAVRRACGSRSAFLLNDLQATAFSIPFLPPGSQAVLQAGEPDPNGTVAVLAAGTGLGEAFLVPSGRSGHIPLASEGGHVDFAPRDEREMRLLRRMMETFGRVSVERVVSGPGIHEIYRFLRESEGMAESPEAEAAISSGDPPREIAREGLSGASPACREALRFFVSLYGAVAGNVALQVLATGGVVLAGGIAPSILPALRAGGFLESFAGKGRFRDLLARIPVRVVLDETAALLGAAHYALAGEKG